MLHTLTSLTFTGWIFVKRDKPKTNNSEGVDEKELTSETAQSGS